jgi:hypothetical protein
VRACASLGAACLDGEGEVYGSGRGARCTDARAALEKMCPAVVGNASSVEAAETEPIGGDCRGSQKPPSGIWSQQGSPNHRFWSKLLMQLWGLLRHGL